MHLDNLDRSRRLVATVVENARVTAARDPVDLRRLVLNIARPDGPCFEGQVFGVTAPDADRAAFRLYTVADVRSVPAGGGVDVGLYVRRYGGPVSGYLCDREVGDALDLYGPYDYRFRLPMDNRSNLVMIGAGTGIAPFSVLVHKAYDTRVDWKGKVRLFHGPTTGMEALYTNEPGDLGHYFDRRTFRAIDALKTRRSIPGSHEPGRGTAQNLAELWDLVRDPDTYVYFAGSTASRAALDAAMSAAAGGADVWTGAVGALRARNHWAELLFD
jgi:ferredoxin--NADP+ reductase